MRGKPSVFAYGGSQYRITPADAGKTLKHTAPRYRAEDHPRGCGENLPDFKFSGDVKGSPPRMRGKLPSSIASSILYRITPADAGKTALMPDGGAVKWDHPRGCGENKSKNGKKKRTRGSPPRMRGKLGVNQSHCRFPWITPADAGKTMKARLFPPFIRDHPRGCGENRPPSYRRQSVSGSPPRMRGKLCGFSALSCSTRITPADAGKTA